MSNTYQRKRQSLMNKIGQKLLEVFSQEISQDQASRKTFERVQVDFSLALAGFLLAIATLLITSFTQFQQFLAGWDTIAKYVESLIPIVGVFAIYGAARIIDYWLDETDKDFWKRLKMFGGGYTIFCFIVSLMTFSLWFLAAKQKALEITLTLVRLYGVTSGLMFLKFMTKDRWPVKSFNQERYVEVCEIFLGITLAMSVCTIVFAWSPMGG